MSRTRRAACLWGLALAAALGCQGVNPAQAQQVAAPVTPADPGVSGRLDKLEKQNELLQKQNEDLRKIVEELQKATSPVNNTSPAPILNKQEVKQIVTEYLQDKDAKAKAEAKPVSGPAGAGWHEVGSDTKFNVSWNNGLIFRRARTTSKCTWAAASTPTGFGGESRRA